ncbi:MAG: hemolysin family protein [Bacteroidetes bacterium]|nr:hemolysin family protein [Bacteroidota bacterium]
MSFPLTSLLLFILTLLIMGFFAGVEMAYYSVNRLSLELKKKKGGSSFHIVSVFIDSPAKFLGATLVGYSIMLVILGLQISNVMRQLWVSMRIGSDTVHIIVEIIIATFIVLIFAEIIPRALFRAKSNTILIRLAYLIDFFYQLFSPIATAFIDFAEWILHTILNVRVNKNQASPINRNDLKNLFQEKADDDRQERNTELMENAQELPKVKIRQCLVPRKEIIGIDSLSTIEELKQKFIETKLSKLVVYEGNIDHIIGYVHQLGLFKNPATIEAALLPIPAVPESMSASDLISKFTRERKSIAWVVDEFGGTAGIITMEDVLEELFGEIQDEYDTEEFEEKQLGENEYMFSGRLELDYLQKKYGLQFSHEDAETLSGYIIHYHETIPRQKERIIIDDYEFEIHTVSDTRIEMVRMKKLK